jgi:uncharacterized protein
MDMTDFTETPLTATQARVLGTLMEKARTVPDSYPLSLNSLTLGCNQKTSRDPVLNLSEADVQDAIDALKLRHLVFEASGSRVARFEHNWMRAVGTNEQSMVLLGLLMLRGPQTAAELRINAERWYKFADSGSVEVFLQELAERSTDKGGAMTVLLPKAPGAREARWAHLLSGPVASVAQAEQAADDVPRVADTYRALNQRIEQLEAQVASLQTKLGGVMEQLGIS